MKPVLQQSTGTRLDYLRKAMRYCRKVYNEQRIENPVCHVSHCANNAMRQTEAKFTDLGTFGVEGACFRAAWNEGISYLNMGETYEPTICFRSDTERFWVGSWGDCRI